MGNKHYRCCFGRDSSDGAPASVSPDDALATAAAEEVAARVAAEEVAAAADASAGGGPAPG